MPEITDYLNEQRRVVDQALEHRLPAGEARPEVLHQAMRYAVFGGGKRLRPILCMAACRACGGAEKDALLPGLAIEILHTYSLVHDDLPCMDDDDLRRGKPTTHKAFGEANAVLAGDALLTLAFSWMAECAAPSPYLSTQLSLELAEAAGHRGIIAGQVEDLASEGLPPDRDRVEFIHLHKTAVLFRAATRIGAIAAGASPRELDALTEYGCDLGLAFQVVDDLLDETGTTEQIGKPAGSDREQNKMTRVAVDGIEASKDYAEQRIHSAIEALDALSGPTEPLRDLAQFIVDRSH